MNVDKTLELAQSKPKQAKRIIQTAIRKEKAVSLLEGAVSLLRTGDVCIDGGANVGLITEKLASTGATVHSFEPDPIAYEQLQNNCSKLENVVLHHNAVGAKAEVLELFRSDAFSNDPIEQTVSSTLVQNLDGRYAASGVKVKVVNLIDFMDDLLTKVPFIAVVKLDIEGFEVEIVEAMIKSNMFSRVRNTLVETHLRKRRDAKDKFKEFRQLSMSHPEWRLNLDWI